MFYLIEIASMADSPAAKAVWDKTSVDDALSGLYQTMASAITNTSVLSCLCMIIDSYGAVIRREYWERTISEEE